VRRRCDAVQEWAIVVWGVERQVEVRVVVGTEREERWRTEVLTQVGGPEWEERRVFAEGGKIRMSVD